MSALSKKLIPMHVRPGFAAAQWGNPQKPSTEVQDAVKLVEDLGETIGNRFSRVESDFKALAARDTARRIGVGTPTNDDDQEARAEFAAFARIGSTAIRAAMTTDSSPDGGYLVPTTIDNQIGEVSRDYSPMRQISGIAVLGLGVGSYEKLIRTSGAGAEWHGEKTAPGDTGAGQYAAVSPPEGVLSAAPRISQVLLDDSQFNVTDELSGDIARAFAVTEGAAFVSGDGMNKPRGFLTVPTIANASWTFGKLGFVVTGDANGFVTPSATVSEADCVKSLFYALKAEYRQRGTFLMSSATAMVASKWKDQEGRYIWRDGIENGQPPTLLGRPVLIDENMPAVAAGNFPIAFGDFSRGYLILDRIGVRVLRDPFTAKPYVIFYTTKRVGGAVYDFAAIKLLKVSA